MDSSTLYLPHDDSPPDVRTCHMMTAPDVRASSRVPQLQLVCSVMYLKVFQDSLQGGMKVGGGRLCGGGQAGSVVYLNVFQGLLQGEVGVVSALRLKVSDARNQVFVLYVYIIWCARERG